MRSFVSSVVEYLHWIILSLWFGGLAVFGFIVAPAAFRTLPTAQLAGDLVGAVLTKLYIIGTISGLVLLLTAHWLRSRGLLNLWRGIFLLLALVVAFASNVYAQWGVAPRVGELRRALASPEPSQAVQDSRKAEFDRLHHRSVQLMTVNLIALLAAIALSRRTSLDTGSPPESTPAA